MKGIAMTALPRTFSTRECDLFDQQPRCGSERRREAALAVFDELETFGNLAAGTPRPAGSHALTSSRSTLQEQPRGCVSCGSLPRGGTATMYRSACGRFDLGAFGQVRLVGLFRCLGLQGQSMTRPVRTGRSWRAVWLAW